MICLLILPPLYLLQERFTLLVLTLHRNREGKKAGKRRKKRKRKHCYIFGGVFIAAVTCRAPEFMTISVSHFSGDCDPPTLKMTDFRERKRPHLGGLPVVVWSVTVAVSPRVTIVACLPFPRPVKCSFLLLSHCTSSRSLPHVSFCAKSG